jgi:hypothetical protein
MSELGVVVAGGREASLSTLRSLRVALPVGGAYWTVVDADYRLVDAADRLLRDLRFGADRTEDKRGAAPRSLRNRSGLGALAPGFARLSVRGRARS